MKSKIFKKFFKISTCLTLSLIMVTSTFLSAKAASSTDVVISIEPTTINVTVPSTAPFIFNEDGTNTYPTNFTITNNTKVGDIFLSKVDMDANNSGWNLLSSSAKTKELKVNQKDIKFYTGGAGSLKLVAPDTDKSEIGVALYEPEDFVIASGQSNTLAFKIERGAFTEEAVGIDKAFDMTLTFNFVGAQNYVKLVDGPTFNSFIPNSATSVVFTDEVAPMGQVATASNGISVASIELTDVSEEGNGSIVAWSEGNTYKVSTQKSGTRIKANEDCQEMFANKTNLTTVDLSNLDTSSVTTMKKMFNKCTNLSNIEGELKTNNVTDMYAMFQNCTNLETLNVSNWNISKVEDMSGTFYRCSNLKTLDVKNWNTSSVTSMDRTFSGCSSLETLDMSDWKTGNVTNMNQTFRDCTNLSTLSVSGWDVRKVENMQGLFLGCSNLSTVNVSNWKTGNVKDMSFLFRGCSSLSTLDVSNWNTGNVTNMNNMFSYCSSLTSLDLSNWETGNVTNMESMFYGGCNNLTELDVSDWDVSKVTTMENMFASGTNFDEADVKLTNLDVSKWKTTSLENSSFMFYGQNKLGSLAVGGWDVSKIKNMDHMFAWADVNIGDISGWKNSVIENMGATFHHVTNETIDLSGFETSNLKNLHKTFKGCYNLVEIKGLENFDTSDVLCFNEMFDGCYRIEELDLSNFDTRNARDNADISGNNEKSKTLKNMFNATYKLQKLTLGPNFSSNGDGTTSENFATFYIEEWNWVNTKQWQNQETGETYTLGDQILSGAATYVLVNK